MPMEIQQTAPMKFRISSLEAFSLENSLGCGQCFRWKRDVSGRWTGIAHGRVVRLTMPEPGVLQVDGADEATLRSLWIPYLDLERDYAAIERTLSRNDPVMRQAIAFSHGLRLLAQDPWEMLATWLISQNNGIPRITSIVDTLCRCFGEPISFDGSTFHAFPSPDAIASRSCDALDACRAGYRRDYIHRAALDVASGRVDPWSWRTKTKDVVRSELLGMHGVGEKVADCTLLFTGLFHDAFPVDRWVLRVMTERYPGCGRTTAELHRFAAERFGSLAGFAQEYLFHDVRINGAMG